jgi:CDP-glycerol glycerophosphotransferase (TagB/SpsB family)
MKLIKTLSFLFIRFFNLFFLPCHVRADRIVFSSYFSREPEGNIKCVLDELTSRGGYDVRTVFMKYGKSLSGKLRYAANILKELYYFNTSRLVVLEGNSLVLAAIPKKKGVFALQLWHASGAFKKFGQDTERIYKIKGLDAAVVSSRAVKGIYAEALNVPEENVHALGIPRLDPLFDEKTVRAYRDEIIEKYPPLKGRKVLLYAPTFRGKGVDDVAGFHVDLKKISEGLGEEYILAVRLHPLMRDQGLFPGFADLSREDLLKTLCSTDMLITDYSSIIFEYSALNRPMLFLTPDLAEYKKTRGFYRDFATFVPGRICMDEEELLRAVKAGDLQGEKVAAFAAEYMDYTDGRSTERVVDLIDKFMSQK